MTVQASAKGGKKKVLLLLVVVALCSVGAGAAVPQFLLRGSGHSPAPDRKAATEAYLSFGEVTVNLAEGRLSRYLRVKVVLVTTEEQARHLGELVEQRKAVLKSWLIAHLSDKSLRDVTGRVSINRVRREILEHFSGELGPDGTGLLRDVLFEEFVVQ